MALSICAYGGDSTKRFLSNKVTTNRFISIKAKTNRFISTKARTNRVISTKPKTNRFKNSLFQNGNPAFQCFYQMMSHETAFSAGRAQ